MAENMEEKSGHPVPNDNGNFEVARSFRDVRPAHYTLKIESFSLLSQILEDAEVQKYESDIFEAGGFKWKLSLYPRGDQERNGEGYISLYLVMAETNSLPLCWKVNVDFKLFVFDQIRDRYMTIQGTNGKVRRFHRMKTEWGFSQLVSLSSFNDVANGYLIQDMCVFGAEVSVVNDTGRGECLTLLKGVGSTHTWKIDNFSSLGDKIHYSEVFTVDERKWKLELHPQGYSEAKDKYMSLYLQLEDMDTFPPERQTYAKRTLRIVNQNCGRDVEVTGTKCYSGSSPVWGWPNFLPLTDLCDASKGFLVNNTIIFQAEVKVLSTVKKF